MSNRDHGPERAAPDTTEERLYWERVLGDGNEALDHQWEWLRYSRLLYVEWIRRYLQPRGLARVLKTDGFEEMRGTEVTDLLREQYGRVVVMDLAHAALRQSADRQSGSAIRCVQCAAQQLPFQPESFDAVLSLSTLDHFETLEEIGQSLRELHAVTRPGGQMLLTLDNASNPVVWLRNGLPFGLLRWLSISPYRYGATLGPRALRESLEAAGWSVRALTTVMHAPRVASVALSRRVGAEGLLTRERYCRWLHWFEALGDWPTRYWTGYFLLAVCEKP